MTLAIVCGTPEPGRDGIGDHSRLLAAALKARGVPAVLVGMSDGIIGTGTHQERQEALGQTIEVLRLSRQRPLAERIPDAIRFLDSVGAHHLLFAFVVYDYGQRGIMWQASRLLPRVAAGRTASILFHETWIGEEDGAGPYVRSIGKMQRWMVKRFVRTLHPARTYTTNAAYRAMLGQIGIDAQIVPHFGNVPPGTQNAASWLPAELAAAGFDVGPGGLDGLYLVGLFGALYPGLDIPSLLPMLDAAARKTGRRLCIVAIGRMGGRLSEWQAWRQKHGVLYGLVTVGERSPDMISQFINSLDLAIAATSLAQIGKSGTAAAFLEHGIPTLVPVETTHYRFFPDETVGLPESFLRVTPDIVDRLAAIKRGPQRHLLDALADRLAVDLRDQ
ncbi:glycosyltransferase family 4 protein [Reyranella sp. CPCC 100927]|uniref:glycosyltransferase family 4 protein n=1 Tax=Reyranella sp. CPCC 100927 TaxID=2599616 RepID=UPI0011B523C0|nr:glycosyltransferase family 4 protein [Reyranella sp. CPCC 100927]TWT03068.1 glycosyltransferase family 4 protein [Reyranella sp. CPCC 100927]